MLFSAYETSNVTTILLALLSTPTFVDKTADLGLVATDSPSCWVDVDNDGWVDLIAGGSIWLNKEGKKFEKGASVGTVVAADYDNDGYADLFSYSQMTLLHNDAGKGFTPVELPKLPPTVSLGACWGDLDGDGFVDLYIGGYEDWDKDITYPSFILMNRCGRRKETQAVLPLSPQGGARGPEFELTWTEARLRARGVTACDFDRDGDLDVYVSNYRLQPNLLWVNNGKGTFADEASARNAVATSPGFDGGHSIGASWGDFDSDGEFDLFAGNFAHVDDRGDQPKSRFLRSTGRKGGYKFEDKGPCGVPYQESYATPAAGDYDDDGNLDLYFTTVYPTASFNRPNFPKLFRGNGKFEFQDVTEAAGLQGMGATYQAAWADFDHDGDLDLATSGRLMVNQTTGTHWLEVHLTGNGKGVNRSAIGAQVRVKVKGATWTRQVEAGTGEGNQNDRTLHFGLGTYKGPVDLEITWPGGKVQKVKRVKVDRLIRVTGKN